MSLKMPMIFGNGMILQRDKPIKIWGEGLSESNVEIRLSDNSAVSVQADINGNWLAELPPQKTGKELTLTITNEKDKIIYKDISIGEVWIAGGQSNMEYFMQYDADKEVEFEKAPQHDIRFFDYPEISYDEQLNEHDYSEFGFWRKCDKDNLMWFSAVGYYFAEKLNAELDVPIGIIGCNWGGTPACSWMDESYLRDNEGRIWIDEYEKKTIDLDIEAYEKWFKNDPANNRSHPLDNEYSNRMAFPGFTTEEQEKILEDAKNAPAPPNPFGPYFKRRPGANFNTMVKKIAPYTSRGVLWYQGENDAEKAEVYETVFTRLIECWQDIWQDELPFVFAQLAPFGKWLDYDGERYPEIREAQEKVSNKVPNTFMISTSDSGMMHDIHPKHKKPVGTRMALSALGHIYHRDILCDSPEINSIERIKNGIRISFRNADGLHFESNGYSKITPEIHEIIDNSKQKIDELEIIDSNEDKIKTNGTELINNELYVYGEFTKSAEIRFAWQAYYEVNLYNSARIPVKPFKIKID